MGRTRLLPVCPRDLQVPSGFVGARYNPPRQPCEISPGSASRVACGRYTNSRTTSGRGAGITTFSTSSPLRSITAAPTSAASSTAATSPVNDT
jgi:hypothetical protein